MTADTSKPSHPAVDYPAAPRWASTFMSGWHRAECWVAVLAFGFIAVILLLDVIGREIIGPLFNFLGINVGPTGIFASQRLSVYALVIGAFAGIGIATATASHLVPRVLFGVTPKSWGPALDRMADILTGIFLLGVAYYAWVFVMSSKATDLRAPVLDWPVWPVQLMIPLGFFSAAVRYIFYATWPSLRPLPPEFQE